ncbi:MAG: glycogen/starch/alpha-glucan phosphorylase [Acidobacteriota bacterium]
MSPSVVAPEVAFELEESIRWHGTHSLGRSWNSLTPYGRFTAVALAVRDRMMDRLLETEERYARNQAKRVYYLSIEYLIGQSLGANLRSLGLYPACAHALKSLGSSLPEIEAVEPDAALGNGGLGRLAACFLDSLATLNIPGNGYGINYEFGLFKQQIDNGEQHELPDNWQALGTPWLIARSDEVCMVPIYGRIEHSVDRRGEYNPMWMDWKALIGLPYDMLIPGYGGRTVNFLRLYSARASREFDMRIFNDGDYLKAVEEKIQSEMISKVLYPSDAVLGGRELRLAQEYFLVSCSIRDIVRRYEKDHGNFHEFSSKVAIQLNDTHPVLAVVELMRVLIDEKDLSWDEAWEITQATFGYTNHTLSEEALERWPVSLLNRVLPRHLQLIQEINRRFLEHLTRIFPGDATRARRLTLVDESEPAHQVRMVNLAVVGSHSINGVSPIHSHLLSTALLSDFHQLWPERFNNKTNGISPRRWLLHANPALAQLVSASIGQGWITDLNELRRLDPLAEDASFRTAFRDVKRHNKACLGAYVKDLLHETLDPESLFDVQIKRIHAYKRQLLNVLHIVHEYLGVVEDGTIPLCPRTYILAGKAAPGYWLAKQIIKLIHNVSEVINTDPRSRSLMKVVFIPDYRVSVAEKIIPAADLSEQISTAGKEASGTGNMKQALNGAVMIGTYDGTNLDICRAVGEENAFLFGLQAEAARALWAQKSYRPQEICDRDARVARVVDALRSGLLCRHEPGFCAWVLGLLLDSADEYLHLGDLPAYLDAQAAVSAAFVDRERWTRMSIHNVARIGDFSSDRAIREYAEQIWNVEGI